MDLRSKQVPVNQYELQWTPQLWNKSITKVQPLHICFNSTITFLKICNGYYNVLGVKKREGAITSQWLPCRKIGLQGGIQVHNETEILVMILMIHDCHK